MDETRTKCPKRSELKLGQDVCRESVCLLLLVVRRSEDGDHWAERVATVFPQLTNEVDVEL